MFKGNSSPSCTVSGFLICLICLKSWFWDLVSCFISYFNTFFKSNLKGPAAQEGFSPLPPPPTVCLLSLLFVFEAITRLTRRRCCLKRTDLNASLSDSRVHTFGLPAAASGRGLGHVLRSNAVPHFLDVYGSIYVLLSIACQMKLYSLSVVVGFFWFWLWACKRSLNSCLRFCCTTDCNGFYIPQHGATTRRSKCESDRRRVIGQEKRLKFIFFIKLNCVAQNVCWDPHVFCFWFFTLKYLILLKKCVGCVMLMYNFINNTHCCFQYFFFPMYWTVNLSYDPLLILTPQ